MFEVDVSSGSGPAQSVDPEAFETVLERATVALAAEMVGTARRLFDMALAYAKERVQFDVPIGSFQAIQHKLAEVALDLERATSAVYYAAMAIDAKDADRHRATHVAKAAAGTAATRAAKDGIQVHGGIGYTWEHDLHLFIRHAYGSEAWLGTRDWHHDRLAELLF
jgi:alkylation response protein AidB-like acyl-CoA dehydrogenase